MGIFGLSMIYILTVQKLTNQAIRSLFGVIETYNKLKLIKLVKNNIRFYPTTSKHSC